MSVAYTGAQFTGAAFEPIFQEIMLQNATVANELVTIDTNVKGNKPYTEVQASAGIRARIKTPGSGDTGGTVAFRDLLATPKYLMDYDEFDPIDYAVSRFNEDSLPGAFNVVGNRFVSEVIAARAPKMSLGLEQLFWAGATAASKSTIAGVATGTAQNQLGAAEKTLFAALQTTEFDGVLARLIQSYANGANRIRRKVAGTTIDATNIDAEYAKLYANVVSAYNGSALLTPYNRDKVGIFAPYSHISFIETFNLNQTYRDKFTVSEDRQTYMYSGIRIQFVPLPENTMILFNGKNAVWATNTLDDFNSAKVDYLAANSSGMFWRADFSMDCVVMQPGQAILYVG